MISPAAAVRQPGYLSAQLRPLGFAPPPYEGFALLASAHTRMRLACKHIPYACLLCMHDIVNPSPTQYPSWRIFCVYGKRTACGFVSHTFSTDARLITSGRWIGVESLTNFRELRKETV